MVSTQAQEAQVVESVDSEVVAGGGSRRSTLAPSSLPLDRRRAVGWRARAQVAARRLVRSVPARDPSR